MIPVIYPNDGVYIRPVKTSELKVNDIVTFQRQRKLITHRIIYKTSRYYVTKGDNNFESDGKVYPNSIIGKVYKIKRGGQVFSPESLYLIQSSRYFQEIVKVKRAFEKAKIDFLFLKGFPLHLYFEKSHPRRIYADCDILIHPKYMKTVKTILESKKYLILKNYLTKTHEAMKKNTADVYYYKKIKNYNILLDLHYEVDLLTPHISNATVLYPQKYINELTEECLKNRRPIKIDGIPFWILDTDYLIVYLALHIFRHNYQGAFRFQFLDTVIRKEGLNPIFVKHLASIIRKYRLQNFLYPVFVLLKKYYVTSIPRSLSDNIRPTNLYLLPFILRTDIFGEDSRLRGGINRFRNLLFLSPEPWQKKIWVFFNPQVAYSFFWVFWKKLRSKIIPSRR